MSDVIARISADRVLANQEHAQVREDMLTWVRSNGIDPGRATADGLIVMSTERGPVIRYTEYVLVDGKPHIDPDDLDTLARRDVEVPCVVPMPEHIGDLVADVGRPDA